jgi:hypothetical protein
MIFCYFKPFEIIIKGGHNIKPSRHHQFKNIFLDKIGYNKQLYFGRLSFHVVNIGLPA